MDVPKVPFVASAPEAMSEKAVSIGTWVILNGIPTHVGPIPPLEGSSLVWSVVTCIAHDVFGGYFIFETDRRWLSTSWSPHSNTAPGSSASTRRPLPSTRPS